MWHGAEGLSRSPRQRAELRTKLMLPRRESLFKRADACEAHVGGKAGGRAAPQAGLTMAPDERVEGAARHATGLAEGA
jgi:hypothetical protein